MSAFESVDIPGYSRNDHGSITLDGLVQSGYSLSCATRVADENILVDRREFDYWGSDTIAALRQTSRAAYNAAHHFDRNDTQHANNFTHGLAHRMAFRQGLVNVQAERNKLADSAQSRDQALSSLGKALHGLQDFFSHSNFSNLTPQEQYDLLSLLREKTIPPDMDVRVTDDLMITGYSGYGTSIDPVTDPYPHDDSSFTVILDHVPNPVPDDWTVTDSPIGVRVMRPGYSKDVQADHILGRRTRYSSRPHGSVVDDGTAAYSDDRVRALAAAKNETIEFAKAVLAESRSLATCAVDFEWSPQPATLGQPVTFTPRLGAPAFSPTSWTWRFGDPLIPDSASTTPAVSYRAAGEYKVSLVAANEDTTAIVERVVTVRRALVGALAFASGGRIASQSRVQLFSSERVPPTSAPAPLTSAGGGNQESRRPALARNGMLAYQFGAPGTRGIHIIDRVGNDRRATPAPSTGYACSDNRDPDWSPDGTQIVYSCMTNTGPVTSGGSYDVWLMNVVVDSTGVPRGVLHRPLVSNSGTLELAPAWSPDGRTIAFVMAGPGAKARIAKLDVASNRVDYLTKGGVDVAGNSTNWDPTWSPDGKQLAFSSTRSGGRHIFVMSTECPEFQQGCPLATRLTVESFDHSNPAWAPDGSKLVFVSNRSGRRHLFTLDPSRPEGPDNPAMAITDGDTDDEDPAWNPNFNGGLNVRVSAPSVVAGVLTPAEGVVTVLSGARTPIPNADVTLTIPTDGTSQLAFIAGPGGGVVANGRLTGKTDAAGRFVFNIVEPAPLQQSSRLDFTVTASVMIDGERVEGSTTGSLYILAFGTVTVPSIGIPNQRMPLGEQPFSRLRKQRFGELALEQSRQGLSVAQHALGTSVVSGAIELTATGATKRFLGSALKGFELYEWAQMGLHYHLAVNLLALAQDPPDANFRTVALPAPQPPPLVELVSPLSSNTSKLVNDGLAVKAVIRAYLGTLWTTINRYTSALAAQDVASATLQRDAILSYQDTLAALFSRDADITQSLLASFQQDGLPNVQLASADTVAIQNDVNLSGFPAGGVTVLQQVGLSSTEIGVVQTSFVKSSPVSFTTDFYALLQSEIQSSRNAALGLTVGATPTDPDPPFLSGGFAYLPPAGTVLPSGVQTLTATFTPADTANFTTATATVPLEVIATTPTLVSVTLDSDSLSQIFDGTPRSVTVTTNPPGLSVNVTYNGAPAAPSTAGSYAVIATITQPGYEGSTTGTLIINKRTPVLTWGTPAAIVFGSPLSATHLNASAPVPGSFAYSPAAGIVLGTGTQTLSVTFTPTDETNYTVATATVTLVVSKATPTITWTAPAEIREDVALGASQLNASADVSGTFTYTPPIGTLLNVGTQTLTVAFAPNDSANYMTASKSVTIVVKPVSKLARFVALGVNQLWVRARAKVVTGDVGANASLRATNRRWDRDDDGEKDDTVEVRFGEHAAMLQPGSRVVGDTVWLRAGASVYDVFENELVNRRATVRGTITSPVVLPFAPLPFFPSVTVGTQDTVVPKNKTVTLASGRYRMIQVKQGGTLILTGGLYEALTVDLDPQATILIRGAVELRIKGELDTGSKSRIVVDHIVAGLKASNVLIVVEGDDVFCQHDGRGPDGDEAGPTSVHIGEQSTIEANIFAPNGTLWLKGRTTAVGAFIGKRVRIGEGTQLALDSAFK